MKTIIGVMGGASVSEQTTSDAEELGRLIAERGWTLLTGGRDAGVMAAASRGAHQAGGLVIGILPGDDRSGVAPGVDIAIPTGMGDARNTINVLASDVVVALPGGAGTVSEIALALKSGRVVVLLGIEVGGAFPEHVRNGRVLTASDPAHAVALVASALDGGAR